jgi:exonuclease SbcD
MNGKLPESDLSAVLRYIVNYTINEAADGLIIAGDLFDTPNIQPPHLQAAADCLAPLKAAGIPVFAIEGNHDRPFLSTEAMTWVRYLNDQEYLHLLTIPFTPDGPIISPWDPESRQGSYIDYRGVRIVGAGYLGAGTVRRMRAIVERFKELQISGLPVILLLHAGPEYLVHEGGGFDRETLDFLREFATYVALGHIHKPIRYHDWAINPGTAENVRLDEAAYDGASGSIPRGMAVLSIEPDTLFPEVQVEIVPVPRRPVRKIKVDCTAWNGRKAGEKIEQGVLEMTRALGVSPDTVLQVELEGIANIERTGLNIDALIARLEEEIPVFAAQIDLVGSQTPVRLEGVEEESPALSREALERDAISKLLTDSPLEPLDEAETSELVELIMALKEDVRHQARCEEILDRIARHAVVRSLAEHLRAERLAESTAETEVAVVADGSEAS